MDAAFLNQPFYLYPIEVQNRGGGGNSLLPLVFSALFKS